MRRPARFTNASQLRPVRLGFALIAAGVLSAPSCPTADDPCGADDQTRIEFSTAALALTSSDLEVTLSGGVRTFSWARVIENVCSKEHAKVTWQLSVQSDKLPPGWRVDAGYVITPVLFGHPTLQASNIFNARIYEGENEIALNQAFQGQPGRFLMFIEMSFTSQGNLQADQAVVQSLFNSIHMIAYYSRPNS